MALIHFLTSRINSIFAIFLTLILLSACSVAKLEARLEANPQCKDIINPKTGALMPCPGTDKAFYAAAGLGPTKSAATSSVVTSSNAAPSDQNTAANSTSPANLASPVSNASATTGSVAQPVECKPKLHQKSGSLMPCPAP